MSSTVGTYSLEHYHTVKLHLLAYLHAEGNGKKRLSPAAFVERVILWPRIYEFFEFDDEESQEQERDLDETPIDSSEENKGRPKQDEGWPLRTRVIETWIAGQTKPNTEKLHAIAEFLIAHGALRRDVLDRLGAYTHCGLLISAAFLDSYLHKKSDLSALGVFYLVEAGTYEVVVHDLRVEPTSDPYCNSASYSRKRYVLPKRGNQKKDRDTILEKLENNKKGFKSDEEVLFFGFINLSDSFSLCVLRPVIGGHRSSISGAVSEVSFNEDISDSLKIKFFEGSNKNGRKEIFFKESFIHLFKFAKTINFMYYVKYKIDSIKHSNFINLKKAIVMENSVQNNLDERVIEAALDGDSVRVMEILDEGADVNARDEKYGYLLIHLAAMYGMSKVLSRLVESPEIDLLTRGPEGLLASMMVPSPDLADDILIPAEKRQAEDKGLDYLSVVTGQVNHDMSGPS